MTTKPLEAVRWISLPSHRDERGVLTSLEAGTDIPFEIKRLFYMHHITADRGGHAHRHTDQVVIAVAGQFRIRLSDGSNELSYRLTDPTQGLYTPRMLFITLFDFSADAVCLVLANTHYNINHSIRSWAEYQQAISARP